jgi:nitroreductase/NAD-dependent dihydropyrimidine dehydrogenase PreA subunit
MNHNITTIIDKEKCTGCGLCIEICPSQAISLANGKAKITGDCSFSCDHCAAICPAEAILVTSLEDKASEFTTFQQDKHWLPPGETDTAELVRLMRSRRSVRIYQEKSVAPEILTDLVKIGTTAPSGTNSQRWTFTIIPDRHSMVEFGHLVAAFYRKLNRLAARSWLRKLLKLFGSGELDFYYREYYQRIEAGLDAWEKEGKDILFHGAPAAILIGARPGASCPREDALLASQNILLAAHAMGLGTCLIGFAVEAMKRDKKIKSTLVIPADEAVYAVIVIGYPAISFQRPAGRKTNIVRYFESPS